MTVIVRKDSAHFINVLIAGLREEFQRYAKWNEAVRGLKDVIVRLVKDTEKLPNIGYLVVSTQTLHYLTYLPHAQG